LNARGEFTVVCFDPQARRVRPFSDDVRRRCLELLEGDEA
jgi:acyl-CoA thioesterase FadM